MSDSNPSRDSVARGTSPSGTDVLIIGGGIMGCCSAYFLKTLDRSLSVQVVEVDPTYAFASTPRASGGCRVQFTCPENIAMSLYSIEFIKNGRQALSTGQTPAEVGWIEGGYLFIVPPDSAQALERNVRVQESLGARVDLLDASGLASRFPSMNVADLAAGAHSPHDGWCDPHSLLMAFRRKAIELGVVFRHDRAIGLEIKRKRLRSALLENGGTVAAQYLVNAAGAWSANIAAMAGMPLPVVPLPRLEHYFTSGTPIEPLPYVKDLARLAFRSEGRGFSGGLVNASHARSFDLEIDHGYFEQVVWPALAHRFPAFEACRCHRTWSGLYEQNELDGNPVIGPWREQCPNLLTIAGFSGHGMMHAPAAGRAIAELIVHGRFQSLDLTRFGYERIAANQPYAETGIL